jgi:hypothetical protein
LQTFPTTPGAIYLLEFALSRDPDGLAYDSSDVYVTVKLDETLMQYVVSAETAEGNRSRSDMQYEVVSKQFQANHTETTLLFAESGRTVTSEYGCVIDAASVVQVAGEDWGFL